MGTTFGALVVAFAKADPSNTPFPGSYPSAPGVWANANPVTPLAGTWQPWVLASGSQFRPPAPPAADSTDFQTQIGVVKNFPPTNATNHSAWFCQPPSSTPCIATVSQEIFTNNLTANPPPTV